MSKGSKTSRKGDSGRDEGGFVALPWSVLDCPAYAALSHPARSLMWEFARQFVRDNNGRLLASRAYLAKRGWKSADTLTNAKRELLASGFIHETVAGQRPNRASWYAITWQTLDRLTGYDVGAVETFQRGAYRQMATRKNATLIPPAGTERAQIVPPAGTGRAPTVPPAGTMRAIFGGLPVPPAGHHLEMPSAAPGFPARIPASRTRMGQMLRCTRPTNRPATYHAARANFAHLTAN